MTAVILENVVEEVAENIYKIRIPMPFKLNHINAYLLQGPNQMALVDTGVPTAEAWDTMQEAFKALNLKMSDLTDIFVTHSHTDHIGQVHRLRREAPEARLLMHQRELELLHGRTTQTAEHEMREWLLMHDAKNLVNDWGGNSGKMFVPETKPQDVALAGGEAFVIDPATPGEWEIVWTPGHTAGHYILVNRSSKTMLSGDHLLGQISSNVGKYPGSTENPLGDYLNSLRKIAELDLQQVLPAHGLPIQDHRERVADLIEHHRIRLEKMYSNIEAGPTTAAAIVEKIWGDRLQGFDRYLALFETLSHLEYLVEEGKVVSEKHNEIIYFRAA